MESGSYQLTYIKPCGNISVQTTVVSCTVTFPEFRSSVTHFYLLIKACLSTFQSKAFIKMPKLTNINLSNWKISLCRYDILLNHPSPSNRRMTNIFINTWKSCLHVIEFMNKAPCTLFFCGIPITSSCPRSFLN